MRKFIAVSLLLGASACGSTSTDNSGTPTPTPGTGAFCGQFTAGTGLVCDTTTSPPTLKVNVGTAAGTVAAGDDPRLAQINPNKGKYLGVFTPTAIQANPPTLASPGGQITGKEGQIIFNNAATSGRVGIRAANEICSSIVDWPGKGGAAVGSAHACSMEELVVNTHAGNILAGVSGLAYNLAPNILYAGTATTVNSWNGDCGGWTYNTGDLFQGTRFDVLSQTARNLLAIDKNVGIKFESGKPCNTVMPIACCE